MKKISNLKTNFMRGSSFLIVLPLVAMIFYSCGPSKKLESANAQINELQTQNGQLTTENNDLKKQVANLSTQNTNLSTQNTNTTNAFNNYKKECEAKAQELKEVNAILEEFRDNVQKLIERLQAAEAQFKDKGLEIYSEDGVVFVNMQDNLLYPSGSAKLSADGKKALGNLASVLNEFPKLKVIVIGNTDTVPLKGNKDNWSLSAERGSAVVRVLSKDYNIDPTRLTAAGKGQYHPVADNSTAAGRAKNRRTEIVLNPDWERIWESVKSEK
jgi:Flagellar motor protein